VRALRYFCKEAFASLWRGRRSGILSVATITTALFVLGAFLLVTSNLERLLARWGSAAEFSVYLRDAITPEEQAGVDHLLNDSGLIAGRDYVSKSEALRRFKHNFADLSASSDSLGDNPFPASLEVRLRPEAASGPAVDRLAERVGRAPGVADVRYDRRWIDRLVAGVAMIRGIGVFLALILILAASLTVANVVRLALYARRDEIQIMELVGAPLAYIRGPFVFEGILQGGTGSIAALALLWIGFIFGRARYGQSLATLVDPSMFGFLPVELCCLLLVGGMAVGCVGGMVAARSAA
jgi:cell division transport system permease protein